MRYKIEKINIILDAFFRLISRKYYIEFKEFLDILIIYYFLASLIEISEKFRVRLLAKY